MSPIKTIEELRQHLFDLPSDATVEIGAGVAIKAATVIELYRATWQGPVALVIHYDAEDRRISLKVEQP